MKRTGMERESGGPTPVTPCPEAQVPCATAHPARTQDPNPRLPPCRPPISTTQLRPWAREPRPVSPTPQPSLPALAPPGPWALGPPPGFRHPHPGTSIQTSTHTPSLHRLAPAALVPSSRAQPSRTPATGPLLRPTAPGPPTFRSSRGASTRSRQLRSTTCTAPSGLRDSRRTSLPRKTGICGQVGKRFS